MGTETETRCPKCEKKLDTYHCIICHKEFPSLRNDVDPTDINDKPLSKTQLRKAKDEAIKNFEEVKIHFQTCKDGALLNPLPRLPD